LTECQKVQIVDVRHRERHT